MLANYGRAGVSLSPLQANGPLFGTNGRISLELTILQRKEMQKAIQTAMKQLLEPTFIAQYNMIRMPTEDATTLNIYLLTKTLASELQHYFELKAKQADTSEQEAKLDQLREERITHINSLIELKISKRIKQARKPPMLESRIADLIRLHPNKDSISDIRDHIKTETKVTLSEEDISDIIRLQKRQQRVLGITNCEEELAVYQSEIADSQTNIYLLRKALELRKAETVRPHIEQLKTSLLEDVPKVSKKITHSTEEAAGLTKETEQAYRQMKVLTNALDIAFDTLGGMDRKGQTPTPLILHVLGVMHNAIAFGGNLAEVATAILHDVCEDGGGEQVLSRIQNEIPDHGHTVARYVQGCTETYVNYANSDKPKDWMDMKLDGISQLIRKDALEAVLFVTACDKLDNVRYGGVYSIPKGDMAAWRGFKFRHNEMGFLWTYQAFADALTIQADHIKRLRLPVYHLNKCLTEVIENAPDSSSMDDPRPTLTLQKVRQWIPPELRENPEESPYGQKIPVDTVRHKYPAYIDALEFLQERTTPGWHTNGWSTNYRPRGENRNPYPITASL